MDLWPQWRSPLVWDFFAIATYMSVSLLFWYVGLIPDLATLRDRAGAAASAGAGDLRPAGARLARRGAPLGALREGLPAAGRAGDAAGGVGALGGLARLRGREHARLPLDDLPALLRGRRAVLGLRDGADAGDPAARAFGLHDFITEVHLANAAKVLLATSWLVAYGYAAEIFTAFYSGDRYEIAMTSTAGPAPTRPCTGACWPVTCCCRSCCGGAALRHSVAALFGWPGHQRRHVDGALPDRGVAAPRLPAVEPGACSIRRSGTGSPARIDRAVRLAVPAVRALPAADLDGRDARTGARERGGGGMAR
jgi:hypothetical protein